MYPIMSTDLLKQLQYKLINLDNYKEAIEIHKKGVLVIYRNPNTKTLIETKNGTISKAQVIFLVIPGGKYQYISEQESLPIAKKFFQLGYSTATLSYYLSPYTDESTQYNQCYQSLQLLSIYFKKVVMVGFSAGGHLAGLLGTAPLEDRFNAFAMVLCYPVISFEKNVDTITRANFLGKDHEEDKNLQKEFSVDERVNNITLPTFIWTFKDDKVVPYENTLLMIEQLKKNNIPYKAKIFEHGIHGMALADENTMIEGKEEYKNKEVATWVDSACQFVDDVLKKY